MMKWCFCFKMAILLASYSANALADDRVDFDRDIRPILSDRCFRCHGPDADAREAELRLDLEAGAKDSVVVPGKPEDSELVARIFSSDPDTRMPPAKSKLELSDSERDLLRRWIQQGAPWKQHWAYLPPQEVAIPGVEQQDWCRNPIDFFILKQLEERSLDHAAEASRERLIRRLSFDLTGLPPSLKEIDAFLADQQPGAYERVVDRLLDSKTFGERMASDWLDVARYSDTYGYQVDRDRYVWPWRDWVVRAFNRNLPYDQFITEQLAGDLIPDASDDQILATTFNRLHPQKVEGGSVPEEFRVEYVADRTQTFATALLGLTIECCRCHDHKYDPFLQKEYYQLSAFFDKIDEFGVYSYFTSSVPTPTLLLTNDETKAKIAQQQSEITTAESDLQKIQSSHRAAYLAWLKEKPAPEPLILGRIAHLDFEAESKGPNKSVPGKFGRAIKLSGDDGIGAKVGNFRRFEPFSISLWMQTPDVKPRAVIFHRSRAWTDAGSRGYQLLIEEGHLSASLIHFWPGNAIRIKTTKRLPTGEWHHITVAWNGAMQASGLSIYIDGEPAECKIIQDNLYKNITGGGGDHITIGERFRDRGFTHGLVDEFQVFNRRLTDLEIAQLFDGKSLAEAITAAQGDSLYPYYLSTIDPEYVAQLKTLQVKREQLCKILDSQREIMVMRETKSPQPTYLLKRGIYSARQDKVVPKTPAVLSQFPDDTPHNRLGLAKWLTAPNHPLTARVAVNRFWQTIFGQGLVQTPEDFGRQGLRPTHPELLDWLARDFIVHQWDIKRLLKSIVTSATYRQSATASPELLKIDPANSLLARSPTFRLPAEMLRDHALAVSGLLVHKLGGAPVRPYEVAVSFKPTNHDKGEGLYRRSLYTYWKRTGPAPVMMTLDASKRDVCRVRRERTSTPLEAFVLMNGTQFVEAARGISQKLLKQHGEDETAILSELFRTMTSRMPSASELEILTKLFQQQLAYFSANSGRAGEYLKIGELKADATVDTNRLAALATVANAMFSFDEVLNRR